MTLALVLELTRKRFGFIPNMFSFYHSIFIIFIRISLWFDIYILYYCWGVANLWFAIYLVHCTNTAINKKYTFLHPFYFLIFPFTNIIIVWAVMGRDRMVFGFATTYAISAYEFESRSDEVYSIQHYVIKFVSDLRAGRWFSPGTLVSSTNKTDCHHITEILTKVVLKTLTL